MGRKSPARSRSARIARDALGTLAGVGVNRHPQYTGMPRGPVRIESRALPPFSHGGLQNAVRSVLAPHRLSMWRRFDD